MKALIVVASLCGLAMGGQYAVPAHGVRTVAHAGRSYHQQAYAGPTQVHTVPAGPPVAHVSESYHAGAPQYTKHVEHGVVGQRTVQVGSQAVQVGHEFFVADQRVEQPAPYSFQATAPVNTVNTVPIAPPALPHAAAPTAYAIPPAPVNYGPAPADTVTYERVAAPARAHHIITPRITRVEPELHVNRYPVEVRVDVPVPVHRDVVVQKHVERPYNVPVPRAVPVPKPFKVHPVHEVVETPVVHEHTVSEHYAPAVHTVSHAGTYGVAGYAGQAGFVAPAGIAADVAVAHQY